MCRPIDVRYPEEQPLYRPKRLVSEGASERARGIKHERKRLVVMLAGLAAYT